MTKKIMMSAGEISGDIYGGRLVVELRKLDPTLQFFGMGSQRMLAAGVTLFSDLSDISTIGFVEPLCHIPRIYFTYLKMKKRMAMEKPDLVIPIDFQGYNLLLCKAAKQLSIPSIYYISPQECAKL
jgi:lipid-A-disaccharide synthase